MEPISAPAHKSSWTPRKTGLAFTGAAVVVALAGLATFVALVGFQHSSATNVIGTLAGKITVGATFGLTTIALVGSAASFIHATRKKEQEEEKYRPKFTYDINFVKESSNWVFFTGLFRTGFRLLTSPSNINLKIFNFRPFQNDIRNISLNPQGQEVNNLMSGLHELKNYNGRFFGSSVVISYLSALKAKTPGFDFAATGTIGQRSLTTVFDTYKTFIQAVQYFAIPIDDNGHNVVVFIDTIHERIKFYNPKGATCDAPEASQKLAAEIVKIKEALKFKDHTENYWQNLQQDQEDHHLCGIWCSRFIAKEIGVPDVADDIYKFKDQMIATIEEQFVVR